MAGEERCVRCGKLGQDRRTLWMACFYAMNEMRSVPFEEVAIHGRMAISMGRTQFNQTSWREPDDFGEEKRKPFFYPFYTLRVCKACRASWMHALVQWYRERDEDRGGYVDDDDIRGEPLALQELLRRLEEARAQIQDLHASVKASIGELDRHLRGNFNEDKLEPPDDDD